MAMGQQYDMTMGGAMPPMADPYGGMGGANYLTQAQYGMAPPMLPGMMQQQMPVYQPSNGTGETAG